MNRNTSIPIPRKKEVRLTRPIHVQSPLRFEWMDRNSKSVVIGLKGLDRSPHNTIFIGKIKETSATSSLFNFNLWLNVDYPHIVLICGKRGSGKSYTLGAIAEGLMGNQGVATFKEANYAVLLIDTLGQFWQMKHAPRKGDEEAEEHLSLLKEWGLNPAGIESTEVFVPMGCHRYFPDWKSFSIRVSDLDLDDWCGVLNVDRYSSRIGQLMGRVYEKVVQEGFTWVRRDPDTGEILESKSIASREIYGIEDFIDCLDHDREINSKTLGFETRTIRALRSRLVDLKAWKVFKEKGSPIRDLFEAGKVVVMHLQEANYSLKSLIVGILVKKIFKARSEAKGLEEVRKIRSQGEIEKRVFPPGWILIDEAHNYCPEGQITAAKEMLIRYAKEGRSLGLGLIATTQQPSSLSDELSSQIDLLISHALAFSQDISAVRARLLSDFPAKIRLYNEEVATNTLTRMLRSLQRGDVIISTSDVNRLFYSQIRPRLATHGGGPPKFR